MEATYPIRAVEKITGLPLDTLRAWERRYGAVVPEHTARGRHYGAAQVERLVMLGQLVRRGHAIGGIAGQSDENLRNLLENRPAAAKTTADPPAVLNPILAAVESFDADRAREELSRLAAVLTPRDLLYQAVLPLMREVGARWYDGTFAIAQEHLVSGLLRNLLGGMVQTMRPRNANVKMILATTPGEPHEFGILASAMLASMSGVDAVYLGPNLPSSEIANAAKRASASVVVLGVTIVSESTAEDLRAVVETIPAKAELWLGGRSCADFNIAVSGRRTTIVQDLTDFERACQRLS